MKRFLFKGIILTAVISMLISSAGCRTQTTGSDTDTKAATSQAAPEETKDKEKTPVTLKFYGLGIAKALTTGIQEDEVAKEITKKTGVTVDFIDFQPDDTKLNAMLASGDLPDIVLIWGNKFIQAMIEGNQVIPMDPYLEANGKNIMLNVENRVEFSRKYYSNNTDKLYFLTMQGDEPTTMFKVNNIAPVIRWDYYKELGYPEYNDMFDLLPILAEMQKKHPTNSDGKNAYAISGYFAQPGWGHSVFDVYFAPAKGVKEVAGFMDVQLDYEKFNPESKLLNEDSGYWEGLKWYNKAKQMGILDPDCITMKHANFMEKANANRIYFHWSNFFAGGQTELQKSGEDKGYMSLPLPKSIEKFWLGFSEPLGSPSRLISISKNCKYPDRAMDLIDFLYSVEGNRLIYNGVEGKHWDVSSGAPKLSDEYYKTYLENPTDSILKTGVSKYINMAGRGGGMLDPDYDIPINLHAAPELFESSMQPIDKDYCNHYNIKYPAEIYYKQLKFEHMNNSLKLFLPSLTDEVKRIEDAISNYLQSNSVKLMLVNTDEEFEAGKKKMIEELKKRGLDETTKFWNDAMREAKKAMDLY